MSWHEQHKPQSRAKILNSAAKLFTQRGYARVSINQVMAEAGMTRGAFYAHFDSKSDLYAEAILSAATSLAKLNQNIAGDMRLFAERYLSMAHREGEYGGCPLAFLSSDVQHREAPIRAVYTRVFRGVLKQAAETTGEALDSDRVLQMVVLMVGGLAVARAVDDEGLAEQLLGACRRGVEGLAEDSLSLSDTP